jgi:hypothetical protein
MNTFARAVFSIPILILSVDKNFANVWRRQILKTGSRVFADRLENIRFRAVVSLSYQVFENHPSRRHILIEAALPTSDRAEIKPLSHTIKIGRNDSDRKIRRAKPDKLMIKN